MNTPRHPELGPCGDRYRRLSAFPSAGPLDDAASVGPLAPTTRTTPTRSGATAGPEQDETPVDGPAPATVGHGHSHLLRPTARRPLAVALTLLVSFMLVEVVAAWWSGSLALLADAGHMLADAGALAGALWALHLADRPAHGAMTYGWKRAEIIAAAANGLTLLLVGAFLGFEAVHRLLEPPPVTGLTMTFVAVVGVAVNLAATTVLSRASQTSLNVRAAYLHVLTDLYGFLGTLVAGLVIWRTGWHRADPLASLIVVGLMLHAGWSLTRDSGRILLEAAPTDLDLAEVRAHLLSLEHVVDVHDLHAWTVTSSLPALSAHVVLDDSCFLDAHAPQLLDQLQDCLHDHFDVAHSTFQLEPASHADHEEHGH